MYTHTKIYEHKKNNRCGLLNIWRYVVGPNQIKLFPMNKRKYYLLI